MVALSLRGKKSGARVLLVAAGDCISILRQMQRLVAAADPYFRVGRVAALTGGQNSAVFEVEAEDGSSLVIKIYSDNFHWKMQKELFVYGRLQADDVSAPVPTILASNDTRTVLSHNVLIMTKLDGVHLLSILDELDADAMLISTGRSARSSARYTR